MKELSVIIPVYNSEKTLRKCVESILKMKRVDKEVCLINDGSTDASPVICDELEKEYSEVKVIHIANQGVSHARNLGLENTTGKYVQFVDSDDYVHEDMARKMIDKAEQNESSLVMCGFLRRFYFDEDRYIDNMLSCPEEVIWQEDLGKSFPDLLANGYLNSPCNKIYLREYVKGIQFDENLSMGEDLLFNLDVLNIVEKITILPDAWYYIIEGNPNSLTRKFKKKSQEDNCLIYRKLKKFCEENSLSDDCYLAVSKIFLRGNYLNLEKIIANKKGVTNSEYFRMIKTVMFCEETLDAMNMKLKTSIDWEYMYYRFFFGLKNLKILVWSVKFRKILKNIIRKMKSK